MKLIQLTDTAGIPLVVNPEFITSMVWRPDAEDGEGNEGSHTLLLLAGALGSARSVKETPERIAALADADMVRAGPDGRGNYAAFASLLGPADKLSLVKAMGFEQVHSDHQPECPYSVDPGYVCNCWMPPDEFAMPADVAAHLGQDPQSLQIASARREPIPESER